MKKIDRDKLNEIRFDSLKDKATEIAILKKLDEMVYKINELEGAIIELQQANSRKK
jgi:hypothetical protein